jgi:ubiquinone/menaquinone biosynthesis C-methylase UbiE
MRAELRAQLPRVEVPAGSAAAMALQDRSVDVVFVAEAFHWFGTVQACREIARVLRPGGAAVEPGAVDGGDLPWLERFRAVVRPHRAAAGSSVR